MDNISKVLDFLKIPNSFRDILTLIGGFASAVFLQFISEIDFLSKVNFGHLGRIEIDVAVLIIAFVVGRLFSIFAELCINLLAGFEWFIVKTFLQDATLRVRIRSQYPNPRMLWRRYLREFFGWKEWPTVSYREAEQEITALDMAEAVEAHPSLAAESERSVYFLIFLRISFTTAFISSFYNGYYVLPCLIFLLLIIETNRSLSKKEYQIYRGVVKKNAPPRRP